MKYFILLSGFMSLIPSMLGAQTVFSFTHNDFAMSPQFNRLTDFNIRLEIADSLTAGSVYTNPTIVRLDYSIFGILDSPTPSGFPAFNLQRNLIDNTEFYAQGSSFSLEIDAAADLSDGLQLTELVTFTLDAREVDTGRYHPTYIELFSNGSGLIQNSNNTGGVNPGSEEVVNVDFADEYEVDLQAANSLTIATTVVPEPSALLFSLIGGVMSLTHRKRRL